MGTKNGPGGWNGLIDWVKGSTVWLQANREAIYIQPLRSHILIRKDNYLEGLTKTWPRDIKTIKSVLGRAGLALPRGRFLKKNKTHRAKSAVSRLLYTPAYQTIYHHCVFQLS